jgi:hypothetical protein
MTKGILLHEPDDDVGVAVMDLAAGADELKQSPWRASRSRW